MTEKTENRHLDLKSLPLKERFLVLLVISLEIEITHDAGNAFIEKLLQ